MEYVVSIVQIILSILLLKHNGDIVKIKKTQTDTLKTLIILKDRVADLERVVTGLVQRLNLEKLSIDLSKNPNQTNT